MIYPASNPPANNTRLSIFTQDGPRVPFSSTAVYQYNRSLVMVDVNPVDNIARDPHVNYNLLSTVNKHLEPNYFNIGFACIRDKYVPGNSLQVFLLCYTGDYKGLSNFNGSTGVGVRSFYAEYAFFDATANLSNSRQLFTYRSGEWMSTKICFDAHKS